MQKSKDIEKKLTEEKIMFLRRKQVDPIIPTISLQFENRQRVFLDENIFSIFVLLIPLTALNRLKLESYSIKTMFQEISKVVHPSCFFGKINFGRSFLIDKSPRFPWSNLYVPRKSSNSGD